jgi:hypothetical protein
MLCVTKFNKIIKIDDEIKTQRKIKDDKDNLMRYLRELSRPQYLTPINMIKDKKLPTKPTNSNGEIKSMYLF